MLYFSVLLVSFQVFLAFRIYHMAKHLFLCCLEHFDTFYAEEFDTF